MKERLVTGPMYDLKYGDDPVTGKYEYTGHRIETPGGKLFCAEQSSAGLGVSWSTDFSLIQIRQLAKINIAPDVIAEEINEERLWFIRCNDGSSLFYSDSFNDERVETPQFGISSSVLDREAVKRYIQLTATDEVVSRLDELLEIGELTYGN